MIESYLAEEIAELQALLMHGRIVKAADAKSSVQVLAAHLAGLVSSPMVTADSEEAMRAQADAERLLGGPANE